MNKMKNIVMFLCVLVLISAVASCASAQTYYYTDKVFKEKFGEVKATAPQLKDDSFMYYFDSDAFERKYGMQPAAKPPVAEELPIKPEEKPPAEKPAAANATNATGEIVIIPIDTGVANGTVITVTEETGANETKIPEIVVTEEGGGEVVKPGEGGVVKPAETGVEAKTPGKNESGKPSATAAAAGEGSVPLQIVIIGFLVVVIVIMLVILLTREEKGEKDEEWVEGEFLSKEKKPEKEEGKEEKQDKKDDLKKARPAEKKEEPKADKKKDKKEKDIKPFLLKIKEEINN